MQRYIIVRTFQAIVTLWILSVVVFGSVHLTGDPAAYMIGPETTDEAYEQLKKNLGLDKPAARTVLEFPERHRFGATSARRPIWAGPPEKC